LKSRENTTGFRYFVTIQAILAAILLPIADRIFPEGVLPMSKPANAGDKPPASPERTMPPARNGEIAVKEEYEIARRRGTAEALELFIARHPDSALAERARAELRQMRR
jgi:hypothetical protein